MIPDLMVCGPAGVEQGTGEHYEFEDRRAAGAARVNAYIIARQHI